jgi:hypothetical protein
MTEPEDSFSPFPHGIARCELDSHADNCVAGSNFIIMEHTSKQVDVFGYSKELETLSGIPVVTAGTAWIEPITKLTYLLVLNEYLFFGDRLRHTLICPNQLRANGVIVHDTPTQFDRKSAHSIEVNDVQIPLDLLGVVSFFETRLPRQEEIDDLPQIILTGTSDWFAVSSKLSSQESRGHSWISKLSSRMSFNGPTLPHLPINNQLLEHLDDHEREGRIIAAVHVSATYTYVPPPKPDIAVTEANISVVTTSDQIVINPHHAFQTMGYYFGCCESNTCCFGPGWCSQHFRSIRTQSLA